MKLKGIDIEVVLDDSIEEGVYELRPKNETEQ